MATIELKEGEMLQCPHCHEYGEEPVENYMIPGSVEGDQYEDECDNCYAPLTITRTAEGYRVESEPDYQEDC